MPKKRSSDNYDALGSVFDFIFAESRKPVDKRRPIRPTGVSSESELTDALVSTLAQPGAFMTDTVVGEFNGALDIELASVKFDEAGKVKVSSNSLVDFIKDPSGYIDKAIKRNQGIRKSFRARYLGNVMDDFVVSAWAHRYANNEARGAIAANRVAEQYKVKKAMGQYYATHSGEKSTILEKPIPGNRYTKDLEFMASRSFDLLGEQTFDSARWAALSTNDKEEFSKMVSRGEEKKSNVRAYLNARYGAPIARNFDNATLGKDNDYKVNTFDPTLYKTLEAKNINDKANNLRRLGAPTVAQQDELRMYEKTLFLLERNRRNVVLQIGNIKADLAAGPTPARRAELEQQLKESKNALRAMDGHTVFGQIGKWEGYFNSLKNVYGENGKNLIPSIIDGNFFDVNSNSILNPVAESTVGGVDIYVAASSKFKTLSKYNEMGTKLYYMTPRSVFRTLLYNGEGFAYALSNRMNSIKKFSFLPLAPLGIDANTLIDGLNEHHGADLEAFISGQMAIITGSGLLSASQTAKLSALLDSSKRLRNLTHTFSVISRVQDKINKFISSKFKKLRLIIAEKIFSNPRFYAMLVKAGGKQLIDNWVVGGGIKLLFKGIASAIAGALGLAGGPAAILTAALTWVMTEVAFQILKIGLVITKFVVIGLVALLVVTITLGYISVSSFNKTNFSYYNAIPSSVIQCTAYEEVEIESDDDLPWGNAIIPPPIGESCILGSGYFSCTQGYKDVGTWSHQKMKHVMPVDLGGVSNIYAPQFCDGSGNCKITRIARIQCADNSKAGGIVEMSATNGATTYLFKYLHVKPLAGLGQSLSAGQAVAVVQAPPEVEIGWCWTGKHLHLEIRQNGSPIDPLELLKKFNCNVPSESGCKRPSK